jgi:hypothetical protein
VILKYHPRNSSTLPFLALDRCFPEDLEKAQKTIDRIQAFDADERVFVIFTHDTSIIDNLEFFPATANDWQSKEWKTKSRWAFLPFLQQTFQQASQIKRLT